MASTGEARAGENAAAEMNSCNSALLCSTLRRHAAVDGHNGARGEGALWAEEEGNGVGHVVVGANLRMGVRPRISSMTASRLGLAANWSMGVSMVAGATQFTRIPCSATSLAADWVRPTICKRRQHVSMGVVQYIQTIRGDGKCWTQQVSRTKCALRV